MPRRFVRESKFRHVFGEAHKKTKCYDNIDITKNTWDGGSYCAVNSKFIAVVLERCCFIVVPTEKVGRIEPNFPRISGHNGTILDLQFNPFNTNVIATAGEDARIKIWKIPDGGLAKDLDESLIDLIGHSKKVGIIQWHPTANNIIASGGFDSKLIVWDVENGSPVHVLSQHGDVINSLCWNRDGTLIATTCRDKQTRIIDPRKHDITEQIIKEFKSHDGGKPSRVHFVDDKRLVTIGCKANSERQILLWDMIDVTKPIASHELDSGSGNVLTMYDDILNILYIGVKGDCNIRYFEISTESPFLHYLSHYSSVIPQRGFGVLPKRALNVNKCEIFRVYKLTSSGLCEPISMVVPRRSERFQLDLYPDVPGDTPALTSEEWFNGETSAPKTISLKNGFKPTEKEFTVFQQHSEDNIFGVHMQTAPKREEDLKKAFYQQQDELHKLRELLKNKELKIRQLEYENNQLKKDKKVANELIKDDIDSIKNKLYNNKTNITDSNIDNSHVVNEDENNNDSESDEENEIEEGDSTDKIRNIPEIVVNEYTDDFVVLHDQEIETA